MAVKITQFGIDTIQDNTVTSSKIIDSSISADDLPNGALLQTVYKNMNYDWGSVGNANPYYMSWMDLTLTTRSNNSTFLIQAQYSSDDTNSASYGVGIGTSVVIDGVETWWLYPAAHEDYASAAVDKYKVARHATAFAPRLPKNKVVTFRMYARFNNSNGQKFLGNGAPYYGQRHSVQEFKGD